MDGSETPEPTVTRPAGPVRTFGRAHLIVLAAFFLPTVAYSTLCLLSMDEDDRRDVPVPAAVPFVFAFGPFAGAILRGWRNSRPYEAAVLGSLPAALFLAAVAAQFLIPPASREARAARLAAWAGGLLAWFGSTWVSAMVAAG